MFFVFNIKFGIELNKACLLLSILSKAPALTRPSNWSLLISLGLTLFRKSLIDLNLPFSKPFYSLQCRLRDLDGRLVQGLDHSTELVLLVGTSEESKQAKVMNKAMDRLANLVANRQEAKISQPFDGSMGI